MAKVKLGGDFNEVPDANPAPVGLYIGKLDSVEQKKSKNEEDMVEVKIKLVKDGTGKKLSKKEQYDPLFFYAPTDPDSSWARRMKELLTATGAKTKGTVELKEGTEVLVKLKSGEDQEGNYRPNIAKLMKVGAKAVEDADDEDEDDGDDGDDEVDLDELDKKELKAFIKENDLDIKVKKADDEDAIREKIREALGEDDDDEDDDDEDDDDGPDLDEMSKKELKEFIKENDLDVKVKKSMSDDDIREAIKEALNGDDDEDDDDDDDESGDNYDELDVDTLRQECEDRELPSKGNKAKLIARLRKDDAEEPV